MLTCDETERFSHCRNETRHKSRHLREWWNHDWWNQHISSSDETNEWVLMETKHLWSPMKPIGHKTLSYWK